MAISTQSLIILKQNVNIFYMYNCPKLYVYAGGRFFNIVIIMYNQHV